MLTDTPGVKTPNATRPRLRFRFLRWFTQFLPKREIRVEGAPYLERYYLAGPIDPVTASYWPATDRPKPRLAWLLRRTWYVHRFFAPDADRDLHDHPWYARGRILAGGYIERREFGARVYLEGDPTCIRPRLYHRIFRLIQICPDDPSEVWTLLRCGTAVKSWGYKVGGKHVHYAEYHSRPRRSLRAEGRRA